MLVQYLTEVNTPLTFFISAQKKHGLNFNNLKKHYLCKYMPEVLLATINVNKEAFFSVKEGSMY